MNDHLAEIVCIVDRSGSMQSIARDAIGGFNAFVAAQRKLPIPARLTLVLFDNEYEVVHAGIPLENVPDLTPATYVPRGATALLDAIGRTIDTFGKRLAETPEAERPGKVIVAILTDGEENASHTYNLTQISDTIQHQQAKYSWEFIFLAANQDAIQAGKMMSISPDRSIAWNSTGVGVQSAYASMSALCSDIRSSPRPARPTTGPGEASSDTVIK